MDRVPKDIFKRGVDHISQLTNMLAEKSRVFDELQKQHENLKRLGVEG